MYNKTPETWKNIAVIKFMLKSEQWAFTIRVEKDADRMASSVHLSTVFALTSLPENWGSLLHMKSALLHSGTDKKGIWW